MTRVQRLLQDEHLELLERPVVSQLLRQNTDAHVAHFPIGTNQMVLRKPPLQSTMARRLVETASKTAKVNALVRMRKDEYWILLYALTLVEILMALANDFLAK